MNFQGVEQFGFAAIFGLFCSVVGLVWTFMFPLIVIGFLMSAFLFMVSGGDETRVARARGVFVGAVIACILTILASGVPHVLANVLGATPPPSCT